MRRTALVLLALLCLGANLGGDVQQQQTWHPDIRPWECRGYWPRGTYLTWDAYPLGTSADKLCVEMRTGDHYGWHTPWTRSICVSPTASSVDPLLHTTLAPFSLVKFRMVAVNEYVDPECEGPAHYCQTEAVSEPSNEVCAGQVTGPRARPSP